MEDDYGMESSERIPGVSRLMSKVISKRACDILLHHHSRKIRKELVMA
jgi:hypothetical protein